MRAEQNIICVEVTMRMECVGGAVEFDREGNYYMLYVRVYSETAEPQTYLFRLWHKRDFDI